MDGKRRQRISKTITTLKKCLGRKFRKTVTDSVAVTQIRLAQASSRGQVVQLNTKCLEQSFRQNAMKLAAMCILLSAM